MARQVELATLHNFDLVAQKDLRVGDIVQVKRAGEVIPQVIGPVPDKRDAEQSAAAVSTTDALSVVRHRVGRRAKTGMLYCPNFECPARQLEALVHFASRGAMDIRGLSYARIQQLVDAGLVHDAADLYDLEAEHLIELERFAEKSAEALVEAIEASKAQPLSRLLFGLGIATSARSRRSRSPSTSARWTRLPRRRPTTISAIHGIGETIAESLVSWFADEKARRLIERLRRAGADLR